MMCLPNVAMHYTDGAMGDQAGAYAVEYHASETINHAHCRNVPCSLCDATGQGGKIMIPSHFVCPNGWQKEYNGYIMAGHEGHVGAGSMHYCIDENLELKNVLVFVTLYITYNKRITW